jgi:hypothetical protein
MARLVPLLQRVTNDLESLDIYQASLAARLNNRNRDGLFFGLSDDFLLNKHAEHGLWGGLPRRKGLAIVLRVGLYPSHEV